MKVSFNLRSSVIDPKVFASDFVNAVYSGDIKELKKLLKKFKNKNAASLLNNNGININYMSVNKADCEPLKMAIYKNNIAVAELLLKRGAKANFRKNPHDDAPIHLAAAQGNLNMVNLLIKNGADVNSVDEIGRTPLHVASMNNKPEIVNLLIENRADVYKTDALGNNVYHYLAQAKGKFVSKYLQKGGSEELCRTENVKMFLKEIGNRSCENLEKLLKNKVGSRDGIGNNNHKTSHDEYDIAIKVAMESHSDVISAKKTKAVQAKM